MALDQTSLLLPTCSSCKGSKSTYRARHSRLCLFETVLDDDTTSTILMLSYLGSRIVTFDGGISPIERRGRGARAVGSQLNSLSRYSS